MKKNFKKSLIQSFNKKYNYENEHLEKILKTKPTNKRCFFKTKLGYSLALVMSTVIICCIISVVSCSIWKYNYKKNIVTDDKIIEYVENKYNIDNTEILFSHKQDNIIVYLINYLDGNNNQKQLLYIVNNYYVTTSLNVITILNNNKEQKFILSNLYNYFELNSLDFEREIEIKYLIDNKLKLNFTQKVEISK